MTRRACWFLLVCSVPALGALGACAGGDASAGRRDAGASEGGLADAGLRVDVGRPDAGPDTGPRDAGMRVDAGPGLGTCAACTMNEQCGPFGVCAELMGAFACLPGCNPDIPSCPGGFECVMRVGRNDPSPVCVPVGGRCCIDGDGDGYGVGAQCTGADCDDADRAINPGRTDPEVCNGVDENCNGMTDEGLDICPGRSCVSSGVGFQELAPSACERGACTAPQATSCVRFTCNEGQDRGTRCATTCTVAGMDDDQYCIGAAHCDLGACEDDVGNGRACNESSDCASGFCANGFCCDPGAGECCSQASDCPGASTGTVNTCDDSATCQGSRGMAACVMNRCTTVSGIPDDTGCATTVEASQCGYFRSVFCSGATMQSAPSCPAACTRDDECDAAAHCDGTCVPDTADGSACDEATDCVSGYCNAGVCCAGGDCCVDATSCPARYRGAATCTLPTACQGTRDIATCTAFVCGTLAAQPDDSGCTAATLANACSTYPDARCNGDVDQVPPTCPAMCTGDAQCDAGAHCDASACVTDLPSGGACDEASDCASGFCSNGFCCGGGAGVDCCSRDSDCPGARYGQPSACIDAASCQGTRRDPICMPNNQCALGMVPVDDDSGCAGREASNCGLYPAVSCTADAVQSMPMCRTTCMSGADCDFGANCSGMTCTANGNAGDPCARTDQCNSGLQCVDGVCCSSACNGLCEACNVTGSLGTCSPVPDNQDPVGECSGVACSAYYAGFGGANNDRCRTRADAPASAVACNGARACQTAATVCPLQPAGSEVTDCNDLCQRPVGGTCTGTTAGGCSAFDPGTQTCGTGACNVTVPQCNAGTPRMCVAGNPSTELCNGIDDDCNGPADTGCPTSISTGPPSGGTTYGGTGGGPFTRACNQGEALVGFDGRSGSRVDQLQPICAPISLQIDTSGRPEFTYRVVVGAPRALAAVGGGGGGFFSDRCGTNEVIVGMRGRSGSELDQFAFQCGRVTLVRGGGGAWTANITQTTVSPGRGGSGGGPLAYDCPAGRVVTGAAGRSGSRIDAVGLSCSEVTIGF